MSINLCPNCFAESYTPVCQHCGFDRNKKNNKITGVIPEMCLLKNGQYLVGRTLGKGGFGITYVAYDNVNRRRVAIKECFPDDYCERQENSLNVIPKEENVDPNVSNPEAFKLFLESFEEEIKIVATLANNKYVVNAADYFVENNTKYFVMEYIEGANLKVITSSSQGKISYQNAIPIIFTVGSALMDVHANGIVHKDISPENIMIDSSRNISLIDFGASQKYLAGENVTGLPTQLKPGFAPPEQYDGDFNEGPWSDIYALGATFYSVLTGLPLAKSTDRVEARKEGLPDPMQPLKDVIPDIPVILSDAIEKAMQIDINDRYESIEEFFADIEPLVNHASGIDDLMLNKVKKEASSNNTDYSQQGVPQPYAVIVSGKHAGETYKLQDYNWICIGRNERLSKIFIDDVDEISRQHCRIGFNRHTGRFLIVDISTNGTFFSNSTRMLKNKTYEIAAGKEFYIYSPDIRIRLELR